MSSRAELDNFVLKFHQLRSQGFTAHLELDTHAGQAWVGLKVMLGNVQQQHKPNPKPSRNRSPSYFRRQEKRKAARAADAESQTTHNVNQLKNVTAEEANSSKDVNRKCLIETVPLTKQPTEKVSFECELCDFVSNRESGLKIHTTRKHPTIEQLDGNIEDFQIKNKHWRKEYERHDEFIEDYLMTGEISQEITGNDIKDHLEILLFLLSPHSHQSRSLTSAQHGSEILLLLEVFRTRIDEEYGLGSFVKWSPWKEMQFIAPISK